MSQVPVLRRCCACLAICGSLSAAGCTKETRSIAANLPQTPPHRFDDPRIAEYQDNAYQVSQGGRYYVWYACGTCHDGGRRGPELRTWGLAHGGDFASLYGSIANGHAGSAGQRIPSEQLWQITAYVRDLPSEDPERLRRQDIDASGEPRGTTWPGPVR